MPEVGQEQNNQPVKGETPTLYGSHFFKVRELGEGITGKAEEIFYVPLENLNPVGLGFWVDQSRILAQQFPPRPGQWIREPKSSDFPVLKLPRISDPQIRGQLSQERAALLQLQGIFADDAVARPARLFGYGLRRRTGEPYLVLENMTSDPHMSRLDEYLVRRWLGTELPEKETLEIAIRLAFLLNKAHQQGIVHHDINDQKFDNIFWNPARKHVRLIDWADSTFLHGEYQSGVNPGYDRRGLAQILFKLLTGRRYSDKKIAHEEWEKMSQPTRDIIGRGLNPRNDSYDPKNVEDTAKMYQDLQVAYKSLSPAS